MSMSMCQFIRRIASEPPPPMRYSCIYLNVFSRRLEAAALVEFGLRTGSGRLFLADGPTMANARRPYMCWVGNAVRAVDFAQRNGAAMYWGSWSFRHRWTMTTSLTITRSWTSSQWWSFSWSSWLNARSYLLVSLVTCCSLARTSVAVDSISSDRCIRRSWR